MDNQDPHSSYEFRLSYICDTQFPLKSYAGPNRLFHSGRKKEKFFYYLFDKDNLVIHTNNFECHQKKEYITSNSEKMNNKYKFSKFLTSLFFTQDFIPSRARKKYFGRIRTLLSQQYDAIEARKKKTYIDELKKSNRKMKTYFRFSYANRGFYVGIYEPCGSTKCNFPSTFVMNEDRKRCPHHVKEISHTEDPNPEPLDAHKYIRTYNSHEKRIVNKRLGISYTKVITRSGDAFFYKEIKNLREFKKSTKVQRIRRIRFLNGEANLENNKFDGRLIASFCKKKFRKFNLLRAHGQYKEASIINQNLREKLEEIDRLEKIIRTSLLEM